MLLLGLGGRSMAAESPGGAQSAVADSSTSGDSSSDAPKTLPQENFFSSIKQSLRQGYDHEIVRGHFDLGSPPNPHRYYCLVDTKTGSKEPNGVLGQPVPLPDGTTGLKIDSVSLYGCDKAEKQGMLVTTGYLLKTRTGAAMPATPATPASPSSAANAAPSPPAQSPPAPPAPPAPPQTAMPPPPPMQMSAQTPSRSEVSPDKIDIAGVMLGMSLDEVRAALKTKKLREYSEWTESLSYLDPARGSMRSITGGRFVNVVAAWTPAAAGDSLEADGEVYEVMFTPVPGKERAMAIVHSVGHSAANAPREVELEGGLLKKYGAVPGSNGLPQSPTWRFQAGGTVEGGDVCNRRGLFGGLKNLTVAKTAQENLALKKTQDEFRFQIDHCGVAIVTEDHFTANAGALTEDRLVTRYTVTAYSPAIALDGAKSAAKLIEGQRGDHGEISPSKNRPAPNL
jgi:hypothetical protein